MRTSCDIYKTREGIMLQVSQMETPPVGSVLWHGFDYEKQYWVYEGKRDTRTLEELKVSAKLSLKKN